MYLGIAILGKGCIFTFDRNYNSLIMLCDIISRNNTQQEGQVTLDRSPEFCLKLIIYRYILETGHASGDPPGVLFWS